jgi:hypothetical protein
LPEWFLGGVAGDDKVHKRIVPHDLFVKIGSTEPAEDDRRVWMVLFDELCQAQAAVNMGEPVEIDAEGPGMKPFDIQLGIECSVPQHFQGDVDDPH